MSINTVALVGNLVRDPEVRATTSGNTVMNFSLAVNERERNAQGEYEDVPSYFDMVMFGNRAEAVSRFISKGSKVAVRGHLKQRRWEKDGQRRSKVEVIVEDLDFMSRQQQPEYEEPSYSAPAPKRPSAMEFYDEDMPF